MSFSLPRKPLKRTPMPRGKVGLKRASFDRTSRANFGHLKRRKALGTPGKGTSKNRRALRVFKVRVGRYLIDRCERRGGNCTGAEQLTWAHGRKRRELLEGELEDFAIVCCVNCHREMDEGMSHEGMAAEVSRIIALRPERYLEAA